jgi:hypothetical protein
MTYGTWLWISFDAGRRRPRSASGDSFNSSRSIYFTADYFGLRDNAPGSDLGSLTVNLDPQACLRDSFWSRQFSERFVAAAWAWFASGT